MNPREPVSPPAVAVPGFGGLSRETLRAIPGAGFFVLDRDLRCVFAEGSGGLAGFAPDAVEGRVLRDLLAGLGFPAIDVACRRALGGAPSEIDVSFGDPRRIDRFRFAPVRDLDGEVTGVTILTVEVSSERQVGALELDELGRNAMRASPIGMSLTDPTGRFLSVNPALERLLRRSSEELLGLRFFDVVHPEDRERDREAMRSMTAGITDGYQTEKRYVQAGGAIVHVLVSVSVLRDRSGAPMQYFSQVIDLTERHRSEEEASVRIAQQSVVAALGEHALERLDLPSLLDEAAVGVARTLGLDLVNVLEVLPGGQEVVLRAEVGFEAPTGTVVPVAPGGRLEQALGAKGPYVTDDLPASKLAAPNLKRFGVVSSISVIIGERGQPFGVLTAHSRTRRSFSVEDANFMTSVANVLWDAIERDRTEQQIRHQALHDALTGLPNRVLFLDRLEVALDRAERTGKRLAVLVCDLDNFKIINDSLGHHAGDEVLKELSPRLLRAVRPGDTVARLGGDEFVILCEDLTDAAEAEGVASSVGACVCGPLSIAQDRYRVGSSIGIAFSHRAATAASLLRDADAAMYRAKERGRGRHELFDDSMRARAVARLTTESALRGALEREELRVHYQPYFSLARGELVGMEALLRWEHPQRGLVTPAEFISVAEESGLIVEIGEWVLRESVRQLAAWRRALGHDGWLGVGVNVSGRQLLQPGLRAVVEDVLRSTGLAPHLLGLELTETVLIEAGAQPEQALAALKALGVLIVLDDFGTGYSSLSHLQRFPIDVLKIDRSFVEPLDAAEPSSEPIVKAIIAMAESLGIHVIGEGVETARQLSALTRLGAGVAQGYWFARPMPANEMWQLLEQRLGGGAAGDSTVALPPAVTPR